jgi:hypothetical protein
VWASCVCGSAVGMGLGSCRLLLQRWTHLHCCRLYNWHSSACRRSLLYCQHSSSSTSRLLLLLLTAPGAVVPLRKQQQVR